MSLTERFLRAKHWHLFVLMFGVPMTFQFVMMGSMIAGIATQSRPDPSVFLGFFGLFPIMMIVVMATFFGWFWSIATGLQSRISPAVRLKTGTFKIFFFIPLVYMILLSVGMGVVMSSISDMTRSSEAPDAAIIASSMMLIVPMHLFCMFCIFYCMYFVSKTFKTAELQRKVTFSDHAGEFFLIWFYPIGVWIIQPKINKMSELPVQEDVAAYSR